MMRALVVTIGLLLYGVTCAHPLGNNTVNRQAGLTITRDTLKLHYLVDLAEIPTLLATADADADGDGNTSSEEWNRYARHYGELIGEGIDARVNGVKQNLSLLHAQGQLVSGAAGLYTLRIEADFSSPLSAQTGMKIEYQDHRRVEEPGWKEVFINTARDLKLEASGISRTSQSQDLRVYLNKPGEVLNVLAATAQIASLETATAQASAGQGDLSQPVKSRQNEAVEIARPTQQTERIVDSRNKVIVLPLVNVQTVSQVAPPEPAATPEKLPVWAFFRLGMHHIATGWDHLLFLVGLILTQTSLRRLAGVVTAFTAAHSLTLGLAASGLVSLPGAWVEPAIALTIAYVGLSNLLGFSRHNIGLAFAFGLVHGFGFAGALAESMGSLRAGGGAWLLDLAAFNMGIEFFQIALILLLLPLLRWIQRTSWSAAAFNVASFIVMSAGLGWFFSRI